MDTSNGNTKDSEHACDEGETASPVKGACEEQHTNAIVQSMTESSQSEATKSDQPSTNNSSLEAASHGSAHEVVDICDSDDDNEQSRISCDAEISKGTNNNEQRIQSGPEHQSNAPTEPNSGQHDTSHKSDPPASQQSQSQQHQNPIPIQNFAPQYQHIVFSQPIVFKNHDGFEPTWKTLIAPPQTNPASSTNETRQFKLSLVSHDEFTITPIKHYSNSFHYEPNVHGLRIHIKQIARKYGHGKTATFEKVKLDDGREQGKWRIPLGAYYAFLTFLTESPNTIVEGIPNPQLKIASVARAAAERDYPSSEALINCGVPPGLANALAPYQRGGVDFVLQRNGRALIADDMGLGKTIQSMASMSCYEDEWPLLVLTPSSARYHWEAELLQWMGEKSPINKTFEEESEALDLPTKRKASSISQDESEYQQNNTQKKSMRLLKESHIHVLTTSKDPIFPSRNTRIVICSYGLAPALINNGNIAPGTFRCIIVDESHMLKNKSSKRTLALLPSLKAADRVLMLSGTPALAKPLELYPQLSALGCDNGCWEDEADFTLKYGKPEEGERNFAELHALLKSTVMIRRLKVDILKNLPSKIRECFKTQVLDDKLKAELKTCMQKLREGKGTLAKFARSKFASDSNNSDDEKKSDIPNNEGFGNIGNVGVDEEKKSRKRVLHELFRLTGDAKIPVIASMLQKWLEDSRNGKICIFAHHINVLNAIIDQAALSNAMNSRSKFIRIDGSTSPKDRQEQLTLFQNDATVRVAILGITAAGVGVTLTAASTIWFAELYWTPAILIQAEDRCHRIGQQANVRCLYIIAQGTLDGVLWMLLQQKFQALGEFVEGKDSMDITVHNTYYDELSAIGGNISNDDVDDSNDSITGEIGGEEIMTKLESLPDEDFLRCDIEELGLEEQVLMNQNNDDEEELLVQQQDPKNMTSKKVPATIGSSENHAICLIDDEHEAAEEESMVPKSFSDLESLDFSQLQKATTMEYVQVPNLQLFQVAFHGPRYGFQINNHAGRVIVRGAEEAASVLCSGDIVLAINGHPVPYTMSFQRVAAYLKQSLQHPPVNVMFGRDHGFKKVYDRVTGFLLAKSAFSSKNSERTDKNSVIELLDDE
jgi:SWI/SNF-related matrix-associated actin-dependent regulator 1 of chromatin subfamily A